MNRGTEVNGVGVDWKHPQTAQTVARGGCGVCGGGWGEKSPKAQAQSGPQSRSLLLFVPLSPPCSPPKTLAHGLSRCSPHSGRWRQTEGAWPAGTRGHAAPRPPQLCKGEAEARSALSKARRLRLRPRPAPVALLGARWPAGAGTPGAACEEREQSRPRTGPGERPEQERSPKGQAAGRPAGLGGRERGRERSGAARVDGREQSRAGRANEGKRGDRARTAALRGAEVRRAWARRPERSVKRAAAGPEWNVAEQRTAEGPDTMKSAALPPQPPPPQCPAPPPAGTPGSA